MLESFTGVEPTPWSRYFVARGRALAEHLRAPDDPYSVARLRERRDAALHTGLRVAADHLDRAIDAA